MPVDPTGTKPGLSTTPVVEAKVVDILCRRGCGGRKARVMGLPPQGGQSLFQCTSCNHTWGVAMGGPINF